MKKVTNNITIGQRVRIYDTIFGLKEPNDVNFGWYREGIVYSIDRLGESDYTLIYRFIIDKFVMDHVEYQNSWNIGEDSNFSISKTLTHLRYIKTINNQFTLF